MTTIRAAYYARVSSEQQAAAHTIESQISASASAHEVTAHRYRRSDSLLMMGSVGPHWLAQPWIGCAI